MDHGQSDRLVAQAAIFELAAPLLIGVATTVTGSARLGVSPIILLFILGLILMRWVKPEGDQSR